MIARQAALSTSTFLLDAYFRCICMRLACRLINGPRALAVLCGWLHTTSSRPLAAASRAYALAEGIRGIVPVLGFEAAAAVHVVVLV